MSTVTKIEWCDHTWSPWRGCTKVSPGCANCYAEGLAMRFGDQWGAWGKGKPRVEAKNWSEPVKWNKAAELGECKCCGSRRDTSGTGNCKRCGEVSRIYTRPTVFPSLCDWLDPEVPADLLARFLRLIHDTPNLNWLLLTKRPENWMDRIAEAMVDLDRGTRRPTPDEEISILAQVGNVSNKRFAEIIAPFTRPDVALWLGAWLEGRAPANVWLGTSVEDQERADERIPHLLDIPAAGRFLSVEPLLGPVELDRWHLTGEARRKDKTLMPPGSRSRIDWVIIGGESGPGARPCNVDWIRSIVRQCKVAEVPCFVKQLGSAPVRSWNSAEVTAGLYPTDMGPRGRKPEPMILTHSKGGDPAEWSEDLRVRQFPWATSTFREAAR